MKLFKSIILLLFIGAVILFAVQNIKLVKLSFLNWHLEMPLSLASIIFYILGAISGSIVFSMLKKLTIEDSEKRKLRNN